MRKEKIITRLDRITEFSLCALVFTLPFSKSMVEIFFVCALISWVVKRCVKSIYTLYAIRYTLKDRILSLINAFKPVRTELDLPIAAFIFIGFLSTLYSVSLPLSLEGFFLKLLEWIMIYVIVMETINSRRKLNRILTVILFSIILMTLDGIFQFMTGIDFIRNYPLENYRVRGSFTTANSFAGWLAVMTPLALSLACFRKDSWLKLPEKYVRFKRAIKIVSWVITALLITCLVLTYSRAVWVAFVLSLIFIGILKNKKLFILTLIVLLAFLFITSKSTKERFLSIAPQNIRERVATIFWRSALTTQRPCIALWTEASNIIKDFPMLGCGLNTYATVAPKYKVIGGGGYYPHNSYLHMAAESGLLGLGAFIWIMITLFWTSLTNLRRMQNGLHSAVLTGLLAGLFGFLAHSFVDVNIYTLQLGNLMWFVMGLIIAVQKVSLGGGDD